MSISAKLKEVAKPKFNVGDVVKHKNVSIKPFEVVKIEISNNGISYRREDGYPFLEKHLKLHEEKKPKLTFGDVPVGSGFIYGDGNFGIKVYDNETIDNVFVRLKSGIVNIYQFTKDNPIQRIIPNIEIREVD